MSEISSGCLSHGALFLYLPHERQLPLVKFLLGEMLTGSPWDCLIIRGAYIGERELPGGGGGGDLWPFACDSADAHCLKGFAG